MSYFQNLLTATKTKYASIRDPETDGDTEEDSHIARTLRSYYADSGRAYPDWLGPPPNQQLQQLQQLRTHSPAQSLRTPFNRNHSGTSSVSSAGSANTLSDIFDAPNPQQAAAGGGRPRFSNTRERPNLFPDDPTPTPTPPRSAGNASVGGGAGGGGGGGAGATTAQQRIKERLWGSRGSNPSPPAQQAYQPPPQQGGGGLYQPQQYQPGRSPPPQKPYVAAGMPWDDGSGGRSGGYGGGGGGGAAAYGLRRGR